VGLRPWLFSFGENSRPPVPLGSRSRSAAAAQAAPKLSRK
jgi:hypothetical protein